MNTPPRRASTPRSSRQGATLVLFAVVLTFIFGLVAFAVDIGYIVLIRTQLQVAADSAAMAAASQMAGAPADTIAVAKQFAGYHMAGGQPVQCLASLGNGISAWSG